MNSADQEVDRLMRLLDVGIDALKRDDFDVALMAIKEGVVTAKRFPQKQDVIALPDRSTEKLP